MRTFKGVAELEAAVGTHLGYSEWHTVTQAQIDGFAEHTGDQQWIHVDPVRAAEGPFGATIAHGFLTLSLVPMLASEVYEVDGVTAGLNYGADKLRFPSAVPVGSRVRASVELVRVARVALGYQVATTVKLRETAVTSPPVSSTCWPSWCHENRDIVSRS